MTNLQTTISTFIAVAGLLATPVANADTKWYEGGTLHGSALSEWVTAPQANRVATAADFASGITNKAGKPFKNQVEMRLVALELTLCIDEVGKDSKLGTQDTAVIAALCAQQLKLM